MDGLVVMSISLLAGSLLAFFAPATGEPAAQLGVAAPSDPEAIVGGLEAESCQWPTAVAILEDDPTPVMCTGSLIHPSVVLTAAHCIIPERPIVAVSFGEQGLPAGPPQRVVQTVECVGNPSYYEDVGADVGYCLLAEPVDDVPIVPLLAGCETDAVYDGIEVVIVGFGATWGTYDQDGNLETMGVGTKRWTTQTVDFIDPFFEEINLYGSNGSQSACFGDSGGPALVQLGDGTWRVLGTGSHLYDPGGLPPPMIPDNYCGAGVAYGYVPFAIDWLEQTSGHDLTPCWNGNVWQPEPHCADFPLEPDLAGSWNTSCTDGAVGGALPPACAELPPPGGSDSSGGSEDDGDDTWGVPLDDLGGGWGGSTSAGPGGGWTTSSPDPRPPDEPPPWTSDSDAGPFTGTTTDDPGLDDGSLVERGCACTAGPRPWSAAPWLFVLVGLARRRRYRSGRARA
jgi:MYXO-CTERM domain-containing protein